MKENHKSDFRKLCIKKLEFSSHFSKYYKDKKTVEKLEEFIKLNNFKNILLYIPMSMEVDVLPLINRLRKAKLNVFVPFMVKDSFKLVKYRLPLKKKRFGIREPNNSFCIHPKVDLAIVPVVGMDKEWKRIGFGKGMYDRFFYRLDYKPTIVFTQLTLCKSNEKLSNKYDIQADFIITS
ncbi:5-formyltetrahydrofolate cyclo-ligase [Halarcobacter mediterraneus]|uniref:5-formyltetrahydrofolate cyclo-ligase n=1 Tax=Halarcobacter mediterraneus TaxID=2023153 RepID=A0A4Q1B112_9BACT|nr:5-formyltetrahydrofolate cyclo-ligase [Halarcobacter mediterraneus]RXK14011.1 5-formyltetrahydrofolate cyclo-ligase [Halarcobacter mediterraneus]